MATPAEWVAGARPRTLPAAVAPVAIGTGAAAAIDRADLGLGLLALLVALLLQVGVNYANDYSDGVRGTDQVRVGPVRLVGQGLAVPDHVKRAAFACFGLAGIAGLALTALSGTWWLIAVGALSILAAWRYTGGDRPYGYRGLGEVYVFVFFGLVATLGTLYTQAHRVSGAGVLGAVAAGAIASAILVANNLRDIPTDIQHGKRTLAVRLGDARTRSLYAALLALALVCGVVAALVARAPWALAGPALALPLTIRQIRLARSGATGRALIPLLAKTGVLQLLFALPLAIGLALA